MSASMPAQRKTCIPWILRFVSSIATTFLSYLGTHDTTALRACIQLKTETWLAPINLLWYVIPL